MKRKHRATLKIRSCYPGWRKHLMERLIVPIAQYDKFEMKRSIVGNDICYFRIKHDPGVYLLIEEIGYHEEKN